MQQVRFADFAAARRTLVATTRAEAYQTVGVREGYISSYDFTKSLCTVLKTVRASHSKLVNGVKCEAAFGGMFLYSDGTTDKGEVVYYVTYTFPAERIKITYLSPTSIYGIEPESKELRHD
jgi:hypothetical protein